MNEEINAILAKHHIIVKQYIMHIISFKPPPLKSTQQFIMYKEHYELAADQSIFKTIKCNITKQEILSQHNQPVVKDHTLHVTHTYAIMGNCKYLPLL